MTRRPILGTVVRLPENHLAGGGTVVGSCYRWGLR